MRAAVFTGASRGIGAALAEQAAPHCDVAVAIGRSAPRDSVSRFINADLAHVEATVAALQEATDFSEATDLWFFDCAGVLPLGEIAEKGFVQAAHNALSVCAVTPLAIGAGLAASGSRQLTVVHLSSGAAFRPIAGWGAYGMAKAAAALGWRTFAVERPEVRVHHIDPGVVDTDMQRELRAAHDPSAAPIDRLKSPAEAALRILLEVGFPT